MSELTRKISAEAIASEETAAQGTVEPNNPTNENNEVNVETPVASPQPEQSPFTPEGKTDSQSASSDADEAIAILQHSGYLDEKVNATAKLKNLLLKVNGIHDTKFKVSYLYSQLKRAGYKFVYIDENRNLYTAQLDKLYDDVKDSKEKCFSEVAKVVEARRVLEEGLRVKDIYGNEITLETENLDRYLVLVDGQHRSAVCHEHPEIDLFVEFDDFEGSTLNRIAVLNNKRKDHTGKDQKKSISRHYPGRVPVLDEMEKLQKMFGVTEKYSEAILTGKVDQFKRDELTEIQMGEKEPGEKYVGDSNRIKEGWELSFSLKLSFGSDKNHWRKVRKVELPLACQRTIEGLQDEDQPGAFHRMAMLFSKMDSTQKANVVAKVGTPDLQTYLTKAFNKFVKEHDKAKDWPELEAEFTTAIEQQKREMGSSSSSTTVKKLSSGTPWDVIANRRELDRQQQEKEAKKTPGKPLGATSVTTPVVNPQSTEKSA